jgi:hypothetical protein
VAYSVIRKTMCVYSRNAMLCGSWRGMCKKEEVGGRKRKKEKEKEGSCETHDDGREGI